MDKINLNKKDEMIEKIYDIRENSIGRLDNTLKEKLNNITLDELEEFINKNITDAEKKGEIVKSINLLIENYEIKMASYMKKGYKQGFKDAFELFWECMKE